MAHRSGYEWRVTIGDAGGNWGAKGFSIVQETTEASVANSEGIIGKTGGAADSTASFDAHVRTLRRARITIRFATFNDSADLFAAPLSLKEGDHHAMSVSHLRNNTKKWTFPSVLITKVTQEGEIDGLQPLTIEGITDGAYSYSG